MSRLEELKLTLKRLLVDYNHLELTNAIEDLYSEQYARLAHWDRKRAIPIYSDNVVLNDTIDPGVQEVPMETPAPKTPKKVAKKVELQETPVEILPPETPAPPEMSKKQLHKMKVLAKAKENAQKNIKPAMFLTEPALRKWIEVEGKSYQEVGELCGVLDSEISAVCKRFNIQSRVAKMIALKKHMKSLAPGNP